MDLTRRNIRTENLADAVQRFRDSSAPISAAIRAVYQRWGDKREWQFVIARLTQTEEVAEPIAEIYRDCAFLAMPVKEFTIAAFMETLSGDGYLLHKDFPPLRITEQNLNWTEELIPSYAGALGFPLRKYAARIARDVQFTDIQLIGYGKPFRPSATAYVKEFIGLPQFHGHSDARKGELYIELSDRRGAIRLGNCQLSIEGNANALYLSGQINDGEALSLRNGKTAKIDTEEIKSIELWLLSEDDEVIDFRSSTEWPYKYGPDPAMPQDGAAELGVVIAGGESERCEFKPYIVLTDRDKSLEIEKSVCAFSNARGGHLFIGIDNEGELVGLARELSKTGTPIEKAAEEYAGAIRKRLRENLSSNQCFAAEAMQLYGRTVIVISVRPSTDTNYLLHSDQAYIRRGATSKKMSPPEIAAQLAAKQNHWG